MLAAYNNLAGRQRWHQRWYTLVNGCATGAVLSAAAARGLTASEIGLARDRLAPGLRLGSAWAGGAAAGWLVITTLPAARPVLGDQRVSGLAGRELAYQVLVRIPAGTVLWEEVAFRGVLQAALCRVMRADAAIAVTSGVFGVWHLRPTAAALRANGLAASRGHAVAAVTGGAAATAAGGTLFSWLRLRSGSLAAPVLLHLALNCTGPLAARAFGPRKTSR